MATFWLGVILSSALFVNSDQGVDHLQQLHCKPKPGCTLTKCDPMPDRQSLIEGLSPPSHEYPILCQNERDSSCCGKRLATMEQKFEEMKSEYRRDILKLELRHEMTEKRDAEARVEIALLEREKSVMKEELKNLKKESTAIERAASENKIELQTRIKSIEKMVTEMTSKQTVPQINPTDRALGEVTTMETVASEETETKSVHSSFATVPREDIDVCKTPRGMLSRTADDGARIWIFHTGDCSDSGFVKFNMAHGAVGPAQDADRCAATLTISVPGGENLEVCREIEGIKCYIFLPPSMNTTDIEPTNCKVKKSAVGAVLPMILQYTRYYPIWIINTGSEKPPKGPYIDLSYEYTPIGWRNTTDGVLVEGKYYFAVIHETDDVRLSDGDRFCAESGGKPADILNIVQQNALENYIRALMPSSKYHIWLWLAMTYDGETRQIRSSGGASPSLRWKSGSPYSLSTWTAVNMKIARDATSAANGIFNTVASDSTYGIICEI